MLVRPGGIARDGILAVIKKFHESRVITTSSITGYHINFFLQLYGIVSIYFPKNGGNLLRSPGTIRHPVFQIVIGKQGAVFVVCCGPCHGCILSLDYLIKPVNRARTTVN